LKTVTVSVRDVQSTITNHQSSIINSFLAFWAVMTAAAGDHDSLDGCFADETGFGFATVDAVL
jgi:hypothetical protein